MSEVIDVSSRVALSLHLKLHKNLLLDWRQGSHVQHLRLLSQILEIHGIEVLEAERDRRSSFSSNLTEVLWLS